MGSFFVVFLASWYSVCIRCCGIVCFGILFCGSGGVLVDIGFVVGVIGL